MDYLLHWSIKAMPIKIKSKKIRDELATAVRKRRKKLGYSQEELAYQANIDRTYVSRLEGGKVAISVEIAYQIATALHTSLNNLIKEVEKNLS
ncbi:MAG: helix-turn-helix transcriptional regulator [Saprospiraceae bacterium]|nr:helix-turn-helix transcriptional regulator [Saprospiraceae bacterium]